VTVPGSSTTLDFLSTADMAALERVRIRSRRPIIGTIAGGHRALRRGASLDFAEHRMYADGDDVRHIDYHVLARLDQLVIRQFDAEEQLTVRLFIDESTSMAVGGKYQTGAELISALAFVALRDRDIVSVHTTTGASDRFTGPGSLPLLTTHLSTLDPRCDGLPEGSAPSSPRRTPLDQALASLAHRPGPPGFTVVVSDLFSSDWEAALRRLPHPRRETLVVQVLHPHELTPELRGDVDLIDSETGERRSVSLDAKALQQQADHMAAWTKSVASLCASLGLAYRLLVVGDDVLDLVINAVEGSRP
jgi:uncharacterized protein (DUF58 family)